MGDNLRIGINGFGCIGRTLFRVNAERKLFDIVAINDINRDVENHAYLMKYDSMHGVLNEDIKAGNNEILFNDKSIKVFSESKIENVPWNDVGVDIVVGCTGVLRNVRNAKKCLGKSVKKVIFSDSPRDVDFTFVYGVNSNKYDPKDHNIIAGSICDVVGLAPVLKKIEEQYGIQSGFLLTLHPWLFYQNILDGRPNPDVIKDPNGMPHAIGRGSIRSLIPKNTSLVEALERVMPEIKGKFKAMSYRVPTDIVGSTHLSLILKSDTNTEEVKNFFISVCNKPILDYTEEPLVSIDYKQHESSCVIDGKWTQVMDKRFIRMVTWYDNEWGYTNRLIEIIKHSLEGF